MDVELKVKSGWFSTWKKSALFRCASRCSSPVLIELIPLLVEYFRLAVFHRPSAIFHNPERLMNVLALLLSARNPVPFTEIAGRAERRTAVRGYGLPGARAIALGSVQVVGDILGYAMLNPGEIGVMVRTAGLSIIRQWLRRFGNLTGNLTALRTGEIAVRFAVRFV
jgi:hypothetical protein